MPFDGATRVVLPTFHPGQVAAYRLVEKHKRVRIRCGRRWGKTDFGKILAADGMLKLQNIGWFAPEYKFISEAYNELLDLVTPVKRSSNKMENVIRTRGGGRIDFWSLDNERAGRSRKYHTVIIDEAAFTKPNMKDIWEKSIEPTLLDYGGSCIVLSNTNGVAPDNFLYQLNDPKLGFVDFHAPSWQNPHVPQRKPWETDAEHLARRIQEYRDLKARSQPLVFKQEYEAEFVDWSGAAFFAKESLLVNDQPVSYPKICDVVFAIVDTAVKTNREHDSTAVTYFALSQNGISPHELVVLDWDIVQVEGAFLEHWLPGVLRRCEELARECHARQGSIGAMVEDKVSGTIVLQQMQRKREFANLVHAIDSKLTSMGKDERAIDVSGFVYQGRVKFSQHAWNKTKLHKNTERNHLTTQVMAFRVGQKDQPDDLLDTFTYGVALGIGNHRGF